MGGSRSFGRFPRAVALLAVVGGAIWLLSTISDEGGAQASERSDGLGAWNRVVPILTHPRCLNCHRLNSPRQGDAMRRHIPRVARGPDNHGLSGMRCGNCHNRSGNNDTSGTPGAPRWQLAPVSMSWEGLSPAQICRMLLDRSRNGNRDATALIRHLDKDPLVLWGWSPGRGRSAVPVAHDRFMKHARNWVTNGMPCPDGN